MTFCTIWVFNVWCCLWYKIPEHLRVEIISRARMNTNIHLRSLAVMSQESDGWITPPSKKAPGLNPRKWGTFCVECLECYMSEPTVLHVRINLFFVDVIKLNVPYFVPQWGNNRDEDSELYEGSLYFLVPCSNLILCFFAPVGEEDSGNLYSWGNDR